MFFYEHSLFQGPSEGKAFIPLTSVNGVFIDSPWTLMRKAKVISAAQ
jgi:hypothetical protein